jgi:regulator of protease activity HflC (stomatin/prohibitin superfamily)
MQEKTFKPASGYLALAISIALLGMALFALFRLQSHALWITLMLLSGFILLGFFYLNPNSSRVLTLFGKYVGTVRDNGFFWANPFYAGKVISLRARNFDSEKIKVNDRLGNPILISVILVWRVKDTFKAAFEVDNYENFVKIQSESALRHLAATYPYDNFDDEQTDVTLRSGHAVVHDFLENEVRERLTLSGIEVLEARLGNLSYAPEIAGAMLKRQQAEAVVAARFKIVEGAVGMVENALTMLSKKGIIELDGEQKAAMVSNLMVVLCGDREATPVVNTGTLHP